MKYFVLAGNWNNYEELALCYFESEEQACNFVELKEFTYYRVIKGQELEVVSSISLKEK